MTNAKFSPIDEFISSISQRSTLPLNSLRAFEAAARLASFKEAAAELHVTASAVSHQIRMLEDDLGLRLFERRPRNVQLTEAGGRLQLVATRAFDQLTAVLEELRPSGSAVVVSATPAFAARWILPRLARFQAQHPDITLRLETSTRIAKVGTGGVALAIRYGRGPYPDLPAEVLLRETFVAVAHPDYAARHPNLHGATLLEVAWASSLFEEMRWEHFLAAAGYPPRAADGPVFDDESHAVLAALAGQGAALVSDVLVREELSRGSLVAVGQTSLPGLAYHLITAPGANGQRAPSAVAAWLRSEARNA